MVTRRDFTKSLGGAVAAVTLTPILSWAADEQTVSADAAKHAVENPFLHPVLGDHQILVTLAILTVLAAVFLKGFGEAIGLAAAAALPYLALNLVVLGRGLLEVIAHPELLTGWRGELAAHGSTPMLVAGALLVFPKLALGLSGFETGVSVMPLIDGGDADRGHSPRTDGAPAGRGASGCSGGAGSTWSARSRTSARAAGRGGVGCAGWWAWRSAT